MHWTRKSLAAAAPPAHRRPRDRRGAGRGVGRPGHRVPAAARGDRPGADRGQSRRSGTTEVRPRPRRDSPPRLRTTATRARTAGSVSDGGRPACRRSRRERRTASGSALERGRRVSRAGALIGGSAPQIQPCAETAPDPRTPLQHRPPPVCSRLQHASNSRQSHGSSRHQADTSTDPRGRSPDRRDATRPAIDASVSSLRMDAAALGRWATLV